MTVQDLSVPRPQSKGARTREALLDAAEQGFARHGFDGVSMRQLADSAEQLVGVLTYHFPTKDALFEAVVSRRATELTGLRQDALARLSKPVLEDLLNAFLAPFLDRIEHGGPGWRHYAKILAHIAQDSRWASLVGRLFGDAGRTFIRLFREAEPNLTLDQATRGYVQLIAVMAGLFASTGLLDRLSNGRLSSDDFHANLDPAVQFIAGGLRAYARINQRSD